MSNQTERPVFYEDQILGAADLTSTVEYSRSQQARHNRYLHLCGIAQGLEFTSVEAGESNDKYKIITLSPGMAIDGWGREIVVPQAERVSEDKFYQLNLTVGLVGDKLTATWFPVYLVGQEQSAPQSSFNTSSSCGNSLATRQIEGYDITFGRPITVQDLDTQDAANVTNGAGKGGWKILLGYVSVNENGDKFTDFKYEVNGFGRRYAGVQADEIAARGGTLKMRTQSADPTGKAMAVILNEEKEGLLQFGSLNAQGEIAPVFTVDAQGNVEAAGKIAGAVTPGSVHVQSGIARDGLLLPLPPGIKGEDIDSGKVTLFSHVTLHHSRELEEHSKEICIPETCYVDKNRRIHCTVKYISLTDPKKIEYRARSCDYLTIVSVPATSGDQP